MEETLTQFRIGPRGALTLLDHSGTRVIDQRWRVRVIGVRPDEQRQALGFGARGVLGGLALALAAVPFGLLLFLVEDKWPPLLRIDDGARDGLHAFALQHRWLVVAMETLSTIGRWRMYLPVFLVLAGWLLWRRLARLALFAAVTVGVSPGINDLVKWVVHRTRPMLQLTLHSQFSL